MKVVPMFDQILVRRDEAPGRSAGGILLPETAKDKPQTGVVLAVGPGKMGSTGEFFIRTQVHEGDKIMFGAYAGSVVEVDKEKLLLMPEHEIIATLHEK